MLPHLNCDTWFANSSMPLAVISRFVFLTLSFIKTNELVSACSAVLILFQLCILYNPSDFFKLLKCLSLLADVGSRSFDQSTLSESLETVFCPDHRWTVLKTKLEQLLKYKCADVINDFTPLP
ncbi:hypothetical protein P9112_009553 [Eukaryota sp. TZLM1-RC]